MNRYTVAKFNELLDLKMQERITLFKFHVNYVKRMVMKGKWGNGFLSLRKVFDHLLYSLDLLPVTTISLNISKASWGLNVLWKVKNWKYHCTTAYTLRGRNFFQVVLMKLVSLCHTYSKRDRNHIETQSKYVNFWNHK